MDFCGDVQCDKNRPDCMTPLGRRYRNVKLKCDDGLNVCGKDGRVLDKITFDANLITL